MHYLIAVLIMTTVTLVVFVAAILVPARPREVRRRLVSIDDERDRHTPQRRRRSQERREQMEALAQALGDRLASRREDTSEVRLAMVRAGYRGPNAVGLYYASRFLLAIGLAVGAFTLTSFMGKGSAAVLFTTATGGLLGWILPRYYVAKRKRKRGQKIQLALADMLDMLVVCVEAGLGLNQALVRVAEEMSSLCRPLSDELQLVNIEIQTGTPRDEALRNLGERTDSSDLRALAAMLIQTDRFGTSIARALRVQSDTLRTKRRQRAEEAAAKTTIKLVFPLVLFIFPAMLVVILAPAILNIMKTMGGLT